MGVKRRVVGASLIVLAFGAALTTFFVPWYETTVVDRHCFGGECEQDAYSMRWGNEDVTFQSEEGGPIFEATIDYDTVEKLFREDGFHGDDEERAFTQLEAGWALELAAVVLLPLAAVVGIASLFRVPRIGWIAFAGALLGALLMAGGAVLTSLGIEAVEDRFMEDVRGSRGEAEVDGPKAHAGIILAGASTVAGLAGAVLILGTAKVELEPTGEAPQELRTWRCPYCRTHFSSGPGRLVCPTCGFS